MDPYNKAARAGDSHGDAPAPVNRVTNPYCVILAEVEAGLIIDLAPSCPRWASRRVDQLTVLRDRRLGVEVET